VSGSEREHTLLASDPDAGATRVLSEGQVMPRVHDNDLTTSIENHAARELLREQREANESLVLEAVRASEEADAHRLAQAELLRLHDDLEARVDARTLDLARANTELRREIARREHAEELRTHLLRTLSTAEEEERRRVARDIHDQTGQLLVGLSLTLGAIARGGHLAPEPASQLAEAQKMVDELGRQIHGIALRLRPIALDDLGIPAALEQLAAEWSARVGVAVDLAIVGLEGERLPRDAETVLFRIAQEGLTNVAKHARASNVSLVLSRHRGLVTLTVEDDGIGFEVASVGSDRIGLIGMRERVLLVDGKLDIESAPGSGTTLIARVGLPGSPGEERRG
jgi:signal transduction histidine kinase